MWPCATLHPHPATGPLDTLPAQLTSGPTAIGIGVDGIGIGSKDLGGVRLIEGLPGFRATGGQVAMVTFSYVGIGDSCCKRGSPSPFANGL